MSTEIHTLVDALGNPVGFFLTGGEVHGLAGADESIPTMEADTLIADKAYDADERVIEPLTAAGQTAVIPSKADRTIKRAYDKHIHNARHFIENSSAKLKQFRAIATRYEKTARNFLGGVHLAAAAIRLNRRHALKSRQKMSRVNLSGRGYDTLINPGRIIRAEFLHPARMQGRPMWQRPKFGRGPGRVYAVACRDRPR